MHRKLIATLFVEVRLEDRVIPPSFAGLAPGFAGLNQVNAQIPQELDSGTYTLRIVARGNSSNAVSGPVRRV